MLPGNIADAFNIGDDVVDAYLILRGRVGDISDKKIEVDYRVTAIDTKRWGTTLKVPAVITATYNRMGHLQQFAIWNQPFSSQTLYLVNRFNSITTSMLAIQKLLKTMS